MLDDTPAGDTLLREPNADMIAPAFWTIPADELKVTRNNKPADDHQLMTTDTCVEGTTLRDFITQFARFSERDPMGRRLGDEDVRRIAVQPHRYRGLPAVMMFGGGGGGVCNRADHGIGITGSSSASFGSQAECDFGNLTALPCTDSYALNMFVR